MGRGRPACGAYCHSHRFLRRTARDYARDIPRFQAEDRDICPEGKGNFGERPVASTDSDNRIRRLDHDDISRLPEAGADDNVKVPVPVAGVRHDTDRYSVHLPGPPARCFHNATETSAHNGPVIRCYEISDFPGRFTHFCRTVTSSNNPNLHGCTFTSVWQKKQTVRSFGNARETEAEGINSPITCRRKPDTGRVRT
jgi:hypothetical protein